MNFNIMQTISYSPLTPARWQDFEKLFGPNGGCGGCWCMFWHLTRSDFSRGVGQVNKDRLHQMVIQGKRPGILVYVNGIAKAWCAVAPREDFSALARSRRFKPVDEKSVWSIVCFFIPKENRGNGLLSIIIKTAIQYAGENNAGILEAYPVEIRGKQTPGIVYMGVASTFHKLGFKEAARRSPNHPILRFQINPGEKYYIS